MLSGNRRYGAVVALALLLGGCGSVDGHRDGIATGPRPAAGPETGIADYPVKIGAPYQIGGQTYTPADELGYDEVGYASWYGAELAGNETASGERYNPDAVTAAHKTLPLPSYVEVTSIDTGRTILVRVNDRGPFANDRLIDLSQGAARQLGIDGGGPTGVRVRRVNPPEHERAALRAGGQVAERLETPPALLRALSRRLAESPRPPGAVAMAPPPRPAPAPVPGSAPGSAGATYPAPGAGYQAPGEDGFIVEEAGRARPSPRPSPQAAPRLAPRPAPLASAPRSGGFFVQVASFSSRPRAEGLARKMGAGVQAAGSVYRVRFGPYASEAAARAGVAKASAHGYGDARIIRE